jgi:hypothetical protein
MDTMHLGRIFVSEGAKAALSTDELCALLIRHVTGERRVVATGPEIVSEFVAPGLRGQRFKVWVVTEANGIQTTVLLPRETRYRDDDIEWERTDGVVAEECPGLWPRRSQAARPQSVRTQKPPRTSPTPQRQRGNQPEPTVRNRDGAYWDETAGLVLDYFELLAGDGFSESLVDGFVAWLKRSPAAHRRYVQGDDMDRAALVEGYLKLGRLPRE